MIGPEYERVQKMVVGTRRLTARGNEEEEEIYVFYTNLRFIIEFTTAAAEPCPEST
jgi:hypothetical protein